MKTIIEQLEDIVREICDKYCKYPEKYGAEDSEIQMEKMYNEKCSECPLYKII